MERNGKGRKRRESVTKEWVFEKRTEKGTKIIKKGRKRRK